MDIISLAVLMSLGDTSNGPSIRNENSPIEYKMPWLYALSKKGTVRTYRVEVTIYEDRAVISTLKRVTDTGVWQTDTYEYTEGVNIGKANETTFAEQAINEAKSAYKRLLDLGYSTTRPRKGDKFNTDANGSMKPMLAKNLNKNKLQFPCIVQPKYDGVRCLVFEKDGEVQIVSRKGKTYDIPHLRAWAEEHRELLPLDGELYNHKELTFQEIVSAVKRKSSITPKIRYVVYDKPILDVDNDKRLRILEEGFADMEGAPAYLSPSELCFNMEQVWECHDKYVAEGYEGAIIRNLHGSYEFGFRSDNLMKLKTFKDAEFKIIDILEASGRDAGTAIFVCECEAGTFNVKPQGTRELRKDYFEHRRQLIGKFATVKYQGLSDEGIPRFPSAITVRDYE